MPVLHGFSITVEPGEVAVLLGLNGAGKSTAVKTLCGAVPVTSGDDALRRRGHHRLVDGTCVKAGIVMVPEGRRVFPDLNVEREPSGRLVDPAAQQAWIAEQRDTSPSPAPPRRTPRASWRGACRAASSRCWRSGAGLMANPQVLIIDEASLGLAPVIVKEIFRIAAHWPTTARR